MRLPIKFNQWRWFAAGLVALSGATLSGMTPSSTIPHPAPVSSDRAKDVSPPASEPQAQAMPNCDNPTDQFEQDFCQAQPNCDAPTSQMEMNFCAAWSAKLSDRRLNQVYAQIQAEYRSDPDTQYQKLRLNQLTDAQLAWITYRDTNCKWQTGKYDGGSIQPLIYSSCVDRMTQARTQELLDSLEP